MGHTKNDVQQMCPFCEGTKVVLNDNFQEFPCHYCDGVGEISRFTNIMNMEKNYDKEIKTSEGRYDHHS